MNYAILRHGKLKSHAAIAAVFQHNARLKEEPNVDSERTHRNHLVDGQGKPIDAKQGWLNGRIRERLRESGIDRIREDTVLAIEVLMTTSPEWWDNLGPEGSESRTRAGNAWRKENLQYLRERFGPENVLCVALHLDEKTPHLHAVVTPIMMKVDRRSKSKTPKPTLCAKDFLGGSGRSGLSEIVQSYGKRLEPLGLQPGQPTKKGEKLKKHMPIREHQEVLRQKRHSAELLMQEQQNLAARRQDIGATVISAIEMVAGGHLTMVGDELRGDETGLAAADAVNPAIGKETWGNMAKTVLARIDEATSEAKKIANEQLLQASTDQDLAAKMRSEAAEDRENARTVMQDALKAAEIQKQRLAKDAAEIADQRLAAKIEHGAAEARIEAAAKAAKELDLKKAETDAAFQDLEVQKQQLAKDMAEIADQRSAAKIEHGTAEARIAAAAKAAKELDLKKAEMDAAFQDFEVQKQQLAKDAAEIATSLKLVENKNNFVSKAANDLAQQQSLAQKDRLAARNDKELAASYLAGIEAFHDGKIMDTVVKDGKNGIIFSPKLSDDEKGLLIKSVRPAWDRVCEYVKKQVVRLKQITDREKLVNVTIEAAELARNKAQKHVADLLTAIAKLPEHQRTTPEVLSAKTIVSEVQADDGFNLVMGAWLEKGGRGR